MSIDPRLMERRKTVAEHKAKRNVGRLLKFLAVVLVAGSLVWLFLSPWLSVDQVVTTGIEVSDAHSILVEHRVTAGTPMILLSAGDVEAALEDDPWVASAEVDMDWPDMVTVDISERTPTAWARTTEGWSRRAIDGVALPSGREPNEKMAWIDMLDLPEPDATTSPDLLGSLEFVAALPARLHPGTVLTRRDGELWAVVSGYEVRLGRPDEMAEKALALEALLERDIPRGSTLVLIAPTNPASHPPGVDEDSGGSDEEGGSGDDEAGVSGNEGEGAGDDTDS